MIENAQVYDHTDIYHLHYYHALILCIDTQLNEGQGKHEHLYEICILIAKLTSIFCCFVNNSGHICSIYFG